MEVLSKQIFLERYTYLAQTDATQWFFVKGRPDMTLEIVNVCVLANDDDDMTKLYILVRRMGVVHRVEYTATVSGNTVFRTDKVIYLAPNDELGIEIIADTDNDAVVISVMGIMWSDKEILTMRGLM